MDALFIPSDCTRVLNIVYNQSAIVDDLACRSNIVDILLLAAIELGYQHTQNGPPPFSSSV